MNWMLLLPWKVKFRGFKILLVGLKHFIINNKNKNIVNRAVLARKTKNHKQKEIPVG